MYKFYSAALAAAFLSASLLGTAAADQSHGNAKSDAHGHRPAAHARVSTPASAHPAHSRSWHSHAASKSERAHSMNAHRKAASNTSRGKSATAHGCVNPAGHTRGWCKGNGTYRGRYGNRATSISGTVTAVNGNTVTFLRDNGTVVTVLDQNGTVLNVGGHYTLVGKMVGGQFVLGSNNDRYGQSNQTVSGIILNVGNGTITLAGLPPITINVQQAINNGATNGALTLGRSITAYGYYSNNVFYATAIH